MPKDTHNRMPNGGSISESLVLSLLLSFSGGFQDAYTYVVRGHVFANAQTGNIVLMSTDFFSGNWLRGLGYLLPVTAFALGVFIADNIRYFCSKRIKAVNWRQIILIIEIIIMLAVGLLPESLNTLANIMVSFSCAMQVQAFRKVRGNSYASTMCIGNLRSGTYALSHFLRTKDKEILKNAMYYFSVILAFAAGAGLGGILCTVFEQYGQQNIWISCAVLTVCALLMFRRQKS